MRYGEGGAELVSLAAWSEGETADAGAGLIGSNPQFAGGHIGRHDQLEFSAFERGDLARMGRIHQAIDLRCHRVASCRL